MTDEDLTEIEKRVEAATPGPWIVGYGEGNGRYVSDISSAHGRSSCDICETDSGCYGPKAHDAEFIAHARTDIPALIARVRELEAMLMDHVEANEVARDLLLRALPCVDAMAVAEECQVICGKKPTRALADNIRTALGQNTDTLTLSASWLRDGAQFEHRCKQAGLTKEQVEAVIKAVDECAGVEQSSDKINWFPADELERDFHEVLNCFESTLQENLRMKNPMWEKLNEATKGGDTNGKSESTGKEGSKEACEEGS